MMQTITSTPETTRSPAAPAGDESGSSFTPGERRAGWTMLTYVVIAIVVGLALSAFFFRTWVLFLLGLLVIIPYALVLLAPVWLSRTTSVAQDTPDLTKGDNEASVNIEPGSRPSL